MKKLTQEENKEIYSLLKTKTISARKIASKFGVSRETINRIGRVTYTNDHNDFFESNIDQTKTKHADFRKIYELVFEIFNRFRSNSIPLNSTIINGISLQVSNKLNISNFVA
jgi:IS30 family transposase